MNVSEVSDIIKTLKGGSCRKRYKKTLKESSGRKWWLGKAIFDKQGYGQ